MTTEDTSRAAARGGEGAERSFEEIVEELEAIVARLAGAELGIEAATDLYEEAERLHAQAAARLQAVQERIDRLRSDPPSS